MLNAPPEQVDAYIRGFSLLADYSVIRNGATWEPLKLGSVYSKLCLILGSECTACPRGAFSVDLEWSRG